MAAMKLNRLQQADRARELQITTLPYSPFQTKGENRPDVLALKASCEVPESYKPSAKIPNLDLPSFDTRDFNSYCREFTSWLNLTGQIHCPDLIKV